MGRYRVYIRPGVPAGPADAAELEATVARGARGGGHQPPRAVVEAVIDLALGQASPVDVAAQDEFVVRFQQTCGPAMAKAIEDTAYYRYVRLVGLNEVCGDPTVLGVPVSRFHAFAQGLLARSPRTMTTLSTHDTKRAEDVRARLAVLAERPTAWADWLHEARTLAVRHGIRSDELDVLTEYFLWQTVVGAWPISEERLQAYARKAIRESKLFTRWTEPNTTYESAVESFVTGLVSTPEIVGHLESWVEATACETRATVLGQKLVQLTMPGVPDVYQGTDLVDLSLVDPDNRRPVDYDERRRRLARLDAGVAPADLHDEKLLVTAAALRTRREWAECFVGPDAGYLPLDTTSPYAVAFGRGTGGRADVVTVATRLAGRLRDARGFGDSTVTLPDGAWTDVLSQRTLEGGTVPLATLVGDPDGLPVALLIRVGDEV
jgi:(1->4)-alpha-D-glucan 1-alpha-D-glucosylmutase